MSAEPANLTAQHLFRYQTRQQPHQDNTLERLNGPEAAFRRPQISQTTTNSTVTRTPSTNPQIPPGLTKSLTPYKFTPSGSNKPLGVSNELDAAANIGNVLNTSLTSVPDTLLTGLSNPDACSNNMTSEKQRLESVFRPPELTLLAPDHERVVDAPTQQEPAVDSSIVDSFETLNLTGTTYNMQNLFERERIVSSFDWSTSDITGLEDGTPQWTASVMDLIYQIPEWTRIIDQYRFFKYDYLKVYLDINANPFYSGATRLCYFPGEARANEPLNKHIWTKNGPVIFAAESTRIELIIPWTYNNPFFDTANPDARIVQTTPGVLATSILLPLRCPETEIQSLSVVVQMSIHGLQFMMPMDNVSRTRPTTITQQSMDQNKLSAINYYPTSDRLFNNFDTVSMISQPTQGKGPPSEVCNPRVEMSIKYLIEQKCWRPNLNFIWNATDVRGTILRSVSARVGTASPGIPTINDMLDFLSNYATYYAGSLMFDIILNTNVFHTGQLCVVLAPSGTTITLDNYLAFPNVIWDVKTKRVLTVEVAHTSPQWLKKIVTLDSETTTTFNLMHVLVHVPLRTTTGNITSVDGGFFRSGKTDGEGQLQLFGPRSLSVLESPFAGITRIQQQCMPANPIGWITEMTYHRGGIINIEYSSQGQDHEPRHTADFTLQLYGRTWGGTATASTKNAAKTEAARHLLAAFRLEIEETIKNQAILRIKQQSADAERLDESNAPAVLGLRNPYITNAPHTIEEITTIHQWLSRSQPFGFTPGSGEQFVPKFSVNPFMGNHIQINQMNRHFEWLYAFWGGDINCMVTTDVDTQLFRYLPGDSYVRTWRCGGQDPLINIKNQENFVTFTLPSIGPNSCFLTHDFDTAMPDLQPKFGKYSAYQLETNSYNSSNLAPAKSLVGYQSAGTNFWFGGYRGLPVTTKYSAWVTAEQLGSVIPATFERIDRIQQQAGGDTPFSTPRPSRSSSPIPQHFDIVTIPPLDFSQMVAPSNRQIPTIEDLGEDLEADSIWQSLRRARKDVSATANNTRKASENIAKATANGALEELLRASTAASSSIEATSSDISELIGKMANVVEPTAGRLDGLITSMDSLLTTVKNSPAFAYLNLSETMIKDGIVLLLEVYECVQIDTRFKWVMFFSKLLVTIGLTTAYRNKLVHILSGFFNPAPPQQFKEGIRQQSIGSKIKEIGSSDPLSMCLTMAVIVIGAKSMDFNHVDEKRCKSLWEFVSIKGGESRNVKDGIKNFFEFFKETYDTIIDGLNLFLYADDPASHLARGIDEFQKEVLRLGPIFTEFTTPKSRSNLISKATARKKFKQHYLEFLALTKKIFEIDAPSEVFRKFQFLKQIVESISSAVIDNMESQSIRVDPFHIQVVGDPGIGKSFLCHALINYLCDSQNVDGAERLYPRTEGMDFYDSYTGQYAFYIDDMNQVMSEEAAKEHITHKSNVPVVLNMADLKRKGMFFMSKLMFSTSNQLYARPPGITNLEAYWRRRDILLQASWVHDTDRTQHSDFSHMKFRILHSTKPQQFRTGWLSFREVAHIICPLFSQHLINQQTLVKRLSPDFEAEDVYNYRAEHIEEMDAYIEKCLGVRDDDPTWIKEPKLATPYLGIPARIRQEALDDPDIITLDSTIHISAEPPPGDGEIQIIKENGQLVFVKWEDEYKNCKEEGIPEFVPLYGVPPVKNEEFATAEQLEKFIKDAKSIEYADVCLTDDGLLVMTIQIDGDRIYLPWNYAYGMPLLRHYEMLMGVAHGERAMQVGAAGYMCENAVYTAKQVKHALLQSYIDLRRAIRERSLSALLCQIRRPLVLYSTLMSDLISTSLYEMYYSCMGLEYIAQAFRISQEQRSWAEHVLSSPRKAAERWNKALDRCYGPLYVWHEYQRTLLEFYMVGESTCFGLIYEFVSAPCRIINWTSTYISNKLGISKQWVTIACAGIVIAMLWLWNRRTQKRSNKRSKKEHVLITQQGSESVMPMQDHEHRDLPDDGAKYQHIHLCEKCGSMFHHTHKKNPVWYSESHDHLCRPCTIKKRGSLFNGEKKWLNSAFTLDEAEHDNLRDATYEDSRGEYVVTMKQEATRSKIRRDFRQKRQPFRFQAQMSQDGINKNLIRADNFVRMVEKFEDNLPEELPEDEIEEEPFSPYVIPSDPTPEDKIFKPQEALFLNQIHEPSKQEGCSDPAAYQAAENISLNVGYAWYGSTSLNYLGLRGRKLLVPIHLFKGNFSMPEYHLVIQRFGIKHNVMVKRKNIRFPDSMEFQKTDLMTGEHSTFKLPRDMMVVDLCESPNVPQFADVTRQICELKDMEMVINFPALIVGKVRGDAPVTTQYAKVITLMGECINEGETSREDTAIWRGFKYELPTQPGQCGSPLLTMNSCVPRKIIGFHVGGIEKKNQGYSQMIWRELIEELCGPTNCANGPPYDYLKQQCNTINPKLNLYPNSAGYLILGETPSSMAPLKTQIRPSPLFDRISPHVSEPAPLSPRDPRVKREDGQTPLRISIEKFGKQPPTWNIKFREMSRKHMATQMINATREWPGPKRQLTQEEAINGIPNVLEPINFRTSPGFPFNKKKPSGTIGKSYLFNWTHDHPVTGQPYYEPNIELQTEIDLILKTAKEDNYCINNFYLDWEKDERIAIEKIRDGKVRLFNIHNVAWMIVSRIYYGAAMAAHLWARLKVGSTLGMDMHGPEATELVEFWKSAGPHFFDGDVKNWDGSLDNERMEDFMWVCHLWYLSGDKTYDLQMSRVIGSSTQWRIHVCGKTMYISFWGMPSGHLFTSFFNTGTHNQTKYLIWMEITFKNYPNLCNPIACDEHVRESKHGDDTGAGVSTTASKFYNPTVITEVYKQHGITFTPPQKTKKDSEFMDMNEIRYLKCNFYPDHRFPNLYHMAISKKETIYELTNWIRTGQPVTDAMRQNLEAACKFAYAHGPDFYDEFVEQVNTELLSLGYDQIEYQYEHFDNVWLSQHGIPL